MTTKAELLLAVFCGRRIASPIVLLTSHGLEVIQLKTVRYPVSFYEFPDDPAGHDLDLSLDFASMKVP